MTSKSVSVTRRGLLITAGALAVSACAGSRKSESTGEMIDDTAITTKVKAKFVESDDISVFDVGVETFKGTVQLSGFVDTEEQRMMAEEITMGVSGVVAVENKISIK